ncbi:toxin glutamine deamidase domain-containing protein [Streptomyces sp. bgisy084]|uniref:toxin glutamine deamidase domain-containing protein n=1 Tax=Streptomyces sp. bgisy084 TaxID=3413777 RepID=UPI003D756F7E
MLPDPLEWVLDMLGFNWPHADEDKLLECAQVWRNFAAEVQGHQARGATYASNVLAENSGDAIEGFGKAWEKFSGNSGYLNDAAQAAEVIAFTFEAAATLVIGMKVAVIVQLAILAAEIIAAQAAAPFTLGLSEIGAAAATFATREMVRRILKEVAKQLLDAIMEAAKEPVISALEAMASDLIAQTVNQNFGAQKGYDLGRTAKEGQKAATDALKNTGESLGESLRDGAGGRAGRRARNGLDSAAGHGSDGSDSTDGGSGDGGSSGSDSGSGGSGRGSGSGAGAGDGADGGGSGSSSGAGSGTGSGTGSDGGSNSGSDGGGSGSGSGRASGDTGGSGNRGGVDSGSADSGGSTSHSPRASDNVGTGTGTDGGSGSRTDSGAGSGTNPSSGSDAGAGTGANPGPSADSSSPGSDPSRSVPEAQPLPPPGQRSPFDEGYSGGNDSPYGTSPTPDSGHAPDSGPTPDSGHTPESGPTPTPDADSPSTQPTPDNTPGSARPDPDNITTQPARDTTPDALRPDADNITTQPAPDHTPEGARPAPAPDNTPDAARPAPAPDPISTQPAPDQSPQQGGPAHPDAPQAAPAPSPSPDPVAGNPPSNSDNSPDAGNNSTSNGDSSTGGGRTSMPHAGTPPQGAPVQHSPSSGQPIQQRDPAPGDPMPTVNDPDDTTVTTQSAGTATLPPPTQHTADTGTPTTPSPQGTQPHTPQANGPMMTGAMPPQAGGTGTPRGTTPPTGNTNGNASARPNRRPDGSQAIHDASQQRRPEQPAYNPRLDGPRREETSRPYNPRLDGPRRDIPTTPPGNNRRPDGSQIIQDHTQQPTPERPPHNPRLDGPTRANEPRPEENAAGNGNPATPQSDPAPTTTDQTTPAEPHDQHTPPDTSDTSDASHPADHSTHSDQADHSEQADNSEQADHSKNSDQNNPTPASDTRNRERPGGLDGPTDAHQQQVEDAIPKGEDGEPQRHPDPEDGNWVDSINDPGPDAPGRSNNCVDAALAAADTYSGNPTAAAHRTPDTNPDGTPSDRGENNGRDRIENTLGARFSDYGNGPRAFNRLENDLRNSGHGSQAVIVTQDSKGRAHAWNVVNHNGKITYVDAQTGQRSNKPLHDGTNGVHAIPLNANRRPLQDGSPRHDGATRGDRRPAAEPAGNGKGNQHDPSPDDMDIDEVGQPHDDSDVDMADADGDGTPDPTKLNGPEGAHDPQLGLPPDEEQEKLRSPKNPVYRLGEDALSDNYGADGLSHVHDSLRGWARDGSLASILERAEGRMAAQRRALAAGNTNPPPTTITRRELEATLGDRFRAMNDGQKMAVVGSLARMSAVYHESQGVGKNPGYDSQPYANADARQDGTDDLAKSRDRGVSSQAREEASPNFPVKHRSAPETKRDMKELYNRITGNKASAKGPSKKQIDEMIAATAAHKPDFSGKNYAVVEVVDADGNSTYVVDSSVPAETSGVSPRHSEKHLLQWIDRQNEKPGGSQYTLRGLYTEREPCGKGQGHAHCSDRLREHDLMAGVPVYYSTTYRTDDAGLKLRSNERELQKKKFASQIQAAQAMTDEKDRRAALKEISKKINNEVKKKKSDKELLMQQEMDDHLDVIGEVWATTMRHIVPR